MAAPGGGLARLYWRRESTPGTSNDTDADLGLRLYFDTFQPTAPVNEVTIPEITGSLSYFKRTITRGPINLGARLTFPMRHSGVHAVLLGWGLGTLTSAIAGSYFTHTGTPSDTLESATLFYHFPTISDAGAVVYNQWRMSGCKVQRMLIRCAVGQPVMCEMDILGTYYTLSTPAPDATTACPPDSTGYSPGYEDDGTECPMMMWHKHGSPFQIGVTGAYEGLSNMVTAYEIEINNSLEQQAYIGPSLAQGLPGRGNQANVRARMTIDQNERYWDQILTRFGLIRESGTASPTTAAEIYIKPDAGDSIHYSSFNVGNAYVMDPGGGGSGQYELARNQVEWQACYVPSSATGEDEPFKFVIQTKSDEPATYGDADVTYYDDILHVDNNT